jgi:hypothetical protein
MTCASRPGSSALHRAVREIVQAKQTYLSCLKKFGTTQWVSDAPIETIDDTDLPLWRALGVSLGLRFAPVRLRLDYSNSANAPCSPRARRSVLTFRQSRHSPER